MIDKNKILCYNRFCQSGEVVNLATRTITLRLDEELHRNLKVKMAQEDKKIQEYVAELIRKDIESNGTNNNSA